MFISHCTNYTYTVEFHSFSFLLFCPELGLTYACMSGTPTQDTEFANPLRQIIGQNKLKCECLCGGFCLVGESIV